MEKVQISWKSQDLIQKPSNWYVFIKDKNLEEKN